MSLFTPTSNLTPSVGDIVLAPVSLAPLVVESPVPDMLTVPEVVGVTPVPELLAPELLVPAGVPVDVAEFDPSPDESPQARAHAGAIASAYERRDPRMPRRYRLRPARSSNRRVRGAPARRLDATGPAGPLSIVM